MIERLINLWEQTGIYRIIMSVDAQWWQTLVMLLIVCVLAYLAIKKGFEPLLLLPIAIGMLLTNLPGGGLFHSEYFMTEAPIDYVEILRHGGLLDLLYIGVKTGIYPCIIFVGIGAMTDFTPLISNPKSLLIGAGAQLGVFVAFSGAVISGVFIYGLLLT